MSNNKFILIRINIRTVFDTGMSVPNLMILLSRNVKRATINIIAMIIMPSRLRLKLSCVESVEYLLEGELLFISVLERSYSIT